MAAAAQMEELTSGASGRIIPVFKNLRRTIPTYDSLRRSLIFIQSILLWFLFVLSRNRLSPPQDAPSPASKRRREEEDTLRRRALAESLSMVDETEDGNSPCRWSTSLFFGVRGNALFVRSWFPVTGEMKGIILIIHGLNEHSGRYADFARQLNSCNFGVYAMDWTGHGGSDGLHGYVPSLDHVVADTGALLEKIKLENPGIPCFLFGHSTGGAVVLKAASYSHIEQMLEGIILTSPALRVKPAHPIVGAVAPLFSLIVPKYQFKGANKRGIPVSRDPAALVAKYSDPLVYTGPIRVRTGHEILRISSYLLRKFKSVTIPFFVLHGTADTVTDPLASKDLYNEAASQFKDIKLYEGFLHDLLFEPEREEIGQDIIGWMEKRLSAVNLENVNNQW
ncbi:Caffeoylshikimate esterase [Actinidia chinensis var. chinensis]|uniref:Caffeoylshikimate esterase n=1 Tax=Actinidia chinensis var. chinensis TaxID=1590841 RepID=A0A2R6PIS6_ACTCC|nr:Caffeoylshikimate esterase [Actinidia chinensis var. chinensis]